MEANKELHNVLLRPGPDVSRTGGHCVSNTFPRCMYHSLHAYVLDASSCPYLYRVWSTFQSRALRDTPRPCRMPCLPPIRRSRLTRVQRGVFVSLLCCVCCATNQMVILDEGHRMRNETSTLGRAFAHFHTASRIILTGCVHETRGCHMQEGAQRGRGELG